MEKKKTDDYSSVLCLEWKLLTVNKRTQQQNIQMSHFISSGVLKLSEIEGQ